MPPMALAVGLADGGGSSRRREPREARPSGPGESVRRCLVTGAVMPRESMIRFVLDPDGVVVPDIAQSLPGRGFWLSAGRDVLETASARKSFAKAARRPVTVPADLPRRVEDLLVRRCLDLVGLARRAGAVVSGYEKVRAEIKAGRTAVVFEASDGSPGGREKVSRLDAHVAVVDLFSAAEMGLVLGRDRAVHVAVRAGRMAELLLRETGRLARYRGRPTATSDGL